MNESELDKALMAPLPEVVDDGFSQHVLVRVLEEKARRERNITFGVAGAGVLLCALMPFTRFGQAVDHWAIGFGNGLTDGLTNAAANAMSKADALNLSSLSMPLLITAGALALTAVVLQAFPARR